MEELILEDIAAPDCFVIEEKLKEKLDIPIFHDDQHGTAIITLAALINALDISKKSIKDIKVVVNGAGASAMACTNLFKNSGVLNKNYMLIEKVSYIEVEIILINGNLLMQLKQNIELLKKQLRERMFF